MRWGSLFLIVLIVCGCESSGPETDIPVSPLLHPDVASIPERNAIRITWEPGVEGNLAGYKIYRSTSAEGETFQNIATVSERDDYYEDTDVSIGARYYYRVSAFDDGGNESDMSDVVNYTLLEKPALVEPPAQAIIQTAEPTFSWLSVSGASAYTIHVHGSNDEEVWEQIWQSQQVYSYQSLRKKYNDDGLAAKSLENGMICRWRVDASGGRSAGSQSQWRYFTAMSDQ